VTITIEMLFPEIANLHGDNANIDYLARCLPDARVVRTGLNETPVFVSGNVDLIYLGPLTEKGQIRAIARLAPHKTRIEELIQSGTHFLFTHNAMECLGSRIVNSEMNSDTPGVGIFDFSSEVRMLDRYTGKVMGSFEGVSQPIVGYKSQFSMVSDSPEIPGFMTTTRGIGRNPSTHVEGVRVKNFIGTSLIGPVLLMNPHLAHWLLTSMSPTREPQLAFHDIAVAAYDARLREFQDDRTWSSFERVTR
jgi:CobQ-like glutamine amidotransferase family enzyme